MNDSNNDRDDKGRMVHGHSIGVDTRFGSPNGNPINLTGRPSGVVYVGDWLRQLRSDVDEWANIIATSKDGHQVIAAKLLHGAATSENPSDFLSYIKEILDRTEGRSVQRSIVVDVGAGTLSGPEVIAKLKAMTGWTPEPKQPLQLEDSST